MPPEEPPATPREPPVTPPSTPSKAETEAFATRMRDESRASTVRKIKEGLGFSSIDSITDITSLVSHVESHVASVQKMDATAEEIKSQFTGQIAEKDAEILGLKTASKVMKLDNDIMEALAINKLEAVDPVYLKFKFRESFSQDDEGNFFGNGGKTPMLNEKKDYASVSDLVKEMSIDKSLALFKTSTKVTGTNSDGELSHNQIKAMNANPEFLKKMRDQGHQKEYDAAHTEAALQTVMAKVKQ